MNVFVIDAFEFCRTKGRRSGEICVADLPRLVDEVTEKSSVIQWSLEGGADSLGHPLLLLSVNGLVKLMCQRCLSPFVVEIASIASLILAKDDATADEMESLLNEDDTFDVIVASKTLSVIDLIEDEVLLSIPFSPKHDVCPDQIGLSDIQAAKKPSPFEVLKNFK